jgi:hypothetical protein
MVDKFRAFFVILLMASPAQAADVLICTGRLSETTRMAYIVDHSAGHTCIVNLRDFPPDHDPMQPCSVGDICRVTGRGQSRDDTGKIYVFDEINDVKREEVH